ncbi:hypothetical protein HMPREF1548_00047 [Clostridium sp. KLE 1755]|nr:hypothetical protein HMPREF1548_00047 [Clostridium sp. KLE 1755]
MKKNIENIRLFSWIYLLTTFSAAVIIHPELSLEMDSSSSVFSAYGRRIKCSAVLKMGKHYPGCLSSEKPCCGK